MAWKGDRVNRGNGSDDFDNDGHWSSTQLSGRNVWGYDDFDYSDDDSDDKDDEDDDIDEDGEGGEDGEVDDDDEGDEDDEGDHLHDLTVRERDPAGTDTGVKRSW